MVNVRLRRFVLCLVFSTTLVTSVAWMSLFAQNDTIGVHGSVTTVPAGGLIHKPANFFDLEGTTVTFTPNGAGEYAVTIGNLDWHDPSSGAKTASRVRGWYGYLTIDLPFPLPFAGRTWTRVYANANGNISFQRPERMNWPQRDPWADASMRSVAAAVDSRSAAELEAMIAVLWALYGDTTISVDSTPDRVVITWRAFRSTAVNIYYEPLGENLFQARLYPSGVVELAYRAVPERDGIVGLFHGLNARGRMLHEVEDAVGDVSHAVLDITKAELVDNGSTLLATMTLAEDVPEQVERSAIEYQVIIRFGDTRCAAGIEIDADGRRPFADWCGPQPSVVGYRLHGATIEIPISKTLLNGADHFSWQAGAVWWGEDFDDTQRHTVHVGEPDYDLRALSGTIAGNVFEVFHYPTVPKHRIDRVLSYIYQRAPANDEITVTFTDFRLDDLFSSGGGTGPVNVPVQGIGEWQANPTWGEHYASVNLLTSIMPVFVGAPNFNETGVSNGRQYRAFSPGIRWIAHEAIHRWAGHLSFRHPRTGRIEDLLDDYCRCHWSNYLHAPAAYPVWPSFSSEPYSEASVMGGDVWLDNGDSSFTRVGNSYPLATGLSALDLYVMGMIPPTEVPDTFILRDVQETDRRGTVRATKVPVRIEDIVAAMGPRVPAADVSRKEFRLGVYLLHEDGRPPRMDLLERAQAITASVAEYFSRATGGRMRVVPTLGTAANLPPVPVGTLAPLTIELGEAPVSVEVAGAFRDPDGDPLTYRATSSEPDVVSVSVSKSTVTVTAVAAGTAVVTVTVTDSDGSNKKATQTFTVTVVGMGGISSRLFVPIVLRSQGRTPGSFFTSELTLTNRATKTAALNYTYTAAFGRGSGTAVDSLGAGQQRVIPDAIAYLTSLGVPIGSGSAGGTLVVDFSNLSSPSDAAVTVRVSTPVEEERGRAGLAFMGLNPDGLLTGSAFITGLRQNSQDRSNVAVQNAGIASDGSITLRVTVFSGDPAATVRSMILPDLLTLDLGEFHQYNRILKMAGFDNGYVKVERVSGTAPFYAYGVVNDNFNSDGSFVFPVLQGSLEGKSGQTLPVIIESGNFTSELTVTNFSSVAKKVDFRFVADAVKTDDGTAGFSMELKAGEQRILSRIVDWLRQRQVAGIGAADEPFVGALFATVAEGDMSGIVTGARTGSPDERGGQYSLFYNGVPYGAASIESAWIYGLQQNEENRSNLALVNTGEVDDSSSTFEITIYDGSGESQPRTITKTVAARRWHQINGILGNTSQGYVQVRKTSGNNPFVTYGVINDGGRPGERSGDGAFLPAQP